MIKPYVAGIQPQGEGWIKLNTNENPYPVDVKIDLDFEKLRLYPQGDSDELREVIAAKFDVAPENVFCGNGSDEVLALAFQAFVSGQEVCMPEVSYGFYPVWAQMYNATPKFIPLKNWEIDFSEYSGNCIIANPNAPTGLAVTLDKIPQGGIVIVDEAYIDFANVPSAIELTKKYDNLLVVRTLSKSYSLAGLRVGFAVGNEKLIQKLTDYKNCFNSYPLDRFAQKIAAQALQKPPRTKEIIETRERLKSQINCLNSQANFVFWETPDAKELYEYLLTNKILVRYWGDNELLKNHLRITIGTDKEMEEFVKCVQQFQKEKQKKQT